ncbi:DNA binding protein [Gordonia phage GordDuk1]|uniref:Uncharacterized protein n=1 Tax=Gordonia phage GordDuk1 TaxID=1622191 RepID=A0A0E3T878_9CAUD|nr:DNA binding protein [Gordonia phage GordDuk1]AKC03010.1 hypothetical protein GordDuk1_82 [Gordonia phage GordDuk1]
MTYDKKNGTMRVTVCMEVEVSEKEWMDKYGEAIRANHLVPEVALERATRKATRDGLAALGIPSLVVDKRKK